MATIERGRSRHGHTIRQIVCDGCLSEKLTGQLHGTLYRLLDLPAYLCEVHMIVAGRRSPTPQFIQAIRKVQEKEHAERASGVSVQ